jgi:allophanate hydrolase subunit 1
MRLLPSGERAVLVEVADLDEVLALAGPVRELAGVEDVVPGERTLLVTVSRPSELEAVRALLADVASHPRPAALEARTVEIPVEYDGPDLADVASHTGLSVAELVAAHTATPWRVGFGGFAPGFAYLVGGDPRLEVPRRAEPERSDSRAATPVSTRARPPAAGSSSDTRTWCSSTRRPTHRRCCNRA